MSNEDTLTLDELMEQISKLPPDNILHVILNALNEKDDMTLHQVKGNPVEDSQVTYKAMLAVGKFGESGYGYQFFPYDDGSETLKHRDELSDMLKKLRTSAISKKTADKMLGSEINTFTLAALGTDEEGNAVLRIWSHPLSTLGFSAMFLRDSVMRHSIPSASN